MNSRFNEKKEKLDNLNVIRITYMWKFVAKLALILFDK